MRTAAPRPPPAEQQEPDRAGLLQSLGRLVRGLSTVFWLLPLSLIAQIETTRIDWFGSLGAWSGAPAVVLYCVLLYGLAQLRHFQKQERIWQDALARATFLGVVNAGLTPFIFWWRRFPDVSYFLLTVGLLVVSTFVFLMQLNRVLVRLAAMIPDETLRAETNIFAGINIWVLAGVLLALCAWTAAWVWAGSEASTQRLLMTLRWRASGVILFLAIVPLALTMALIWKIKEVLYAGIFSHQA